MPGIQVPDGWIALPNPNYPQDRLFEESLRRAPLSATLGVDALFSPLVDDGRLKVRAVLFDESKWPEAETRETWLRDNRDRLKWHLPEGRPLVLTREKTVEATVLKEFGPTPRESDMERINALALTELTPDEVYVRPMHLANTQVDRAFERFTERNIRQLSKSIVGKSAMVAHNYRSAPVGRYYDSTIAKVAGVTHVKPFFYIIRAAASAAEAIPQIDGGVWKDVSVGFNYEAMQCDVCLKDYLDFMAEGGCQHIAGCAYPKEEIVEGERYDGFEPLIEGKSVICTVNFGPGAVEGLEGSLGVWLGCQYDTEVVKAHRKLYGDPHEAKSAHLDRVQFVPGKRFTSAPAVTTKASHVGTPSSLPTMPEETPWNPSGAADSALIAAILGDPPNWANYKRVNVWWQDPGETQGDFKLKVGRRDPATDGSAPLKLNWRQTASRMAILNGARGGVNVPAEDREKCYRELVRCYGRFDKEPPELSSAASVITARLEDWTWRNDELRILEEEYPVAGDASVDNPAAGGIPMDEKLKELQAEHEATKAAHAETKAALTALEERVAKATSERDLALADATPLRAAAEKELLWYAQQLKWEDTLTTLAGESGLAGLSVAKLLELQESLHAKWTATLPPRTQIEQTPEPHVLSDDPSQPGAGQAPSSHVTRSRISV